MIWLCLLFLIIVMSSDSGSVWSYCNICFVWICKLWLLGNYYWWTMYVYTFYSIFVVLKCKILSGMTHDMTFCVLAFTRSSSTVNQDILPYASDVLTHNVKHPSNPIPTCWLLVLTSCLTNNFQISKHQFLLHNIEWQLLRITLYRG